MTVAREQSFMKALFHGVIAEDMVSPYPLPTVRERDAVGRLLEGLRRLAADHVDSLSIDRDAAIPPEVFAELRRLGVFGLTVPEELGGLGLGWSAAARVLAELGAIDQSIAVIVSAHVCLGMNAILAFGNDEQKRRLLPKLASGERIAAFALTEVGAGSDASALRTRAELAPDGAGFVIKGKKAWISNAGIADVFVVFARTDSEAGHPRICGFVVEKTHGVTASPDVPICGVRGLSTGSITFEDVKVPARNLLGEYGRGYPLAMRVLNWGRIGMASTCVGGLRRVVKLATELAVQRRAFGRNVGEFGQTKDKVARMGADLYALESMVFLTTGLMDAKVEDFILEAAICKIFASEAFVAHSDALARLAGAHGFVRGEPYERLQREARVHLVLAGTNEILLAFLALAGMQSPGKKLLEVEKAMREPIKGFGLLTDFAVKRARTAFGRERVANAHPLLRAEAVLVEYGVTGLAREVERVLRKHGTAIAGKQFVQRRIAEVAIDLYALIAIVSRTSLLVDQKGEDGARRELDVTAAFCQLAEVRLRDRIDRMERDTDELLKHVAQRAYDDGGFPFDVLR
ncbi:MAG: acyl-CoA dehydrogenase family protein [Polyangiales bacterium]